MELKELCELFIRNRDVIKNKYKLEMEYIQAICALIFTEKRQLIDVDKLEECKNLLKERTKYKFGLSINFRGSIQNVMVSILATDENPAQKIDDTIEFYNELKQYFSGSEYLALGAMITTQYTTDYAKTGERAKKIYDNMKENHSMLTSKEDYIFALLLALSEKSNHQLDKEIEMNYQVCKDKFGKTNATQALSHVLALEDSNANEVVKLYEELKEKGYKYGKEYELPTLGMLTKLGERDIIIDELIEVDEFLATQKGYGMIGIGKRHRLMHAATLVTIYHLDQSSNTSIDIPSIHAATVATLGIVLALDLVIMVPIIASSNN
ncbi:MAG: hypothetical protein BEN19_07415 [Epulopiscium sp. Nuni2H_MBin003]|nr:MAG: hypothetical protein BEN19_07415 [Epulopiscium sp. Nuni2H_MBin003]